MSPTRRATTSVRELSRDEARRIAIRAQLLDAERPTDLVTMVEHLMFVQIDPTAAVAPTADLVAWSRLGGSYDPNDMKRALEQDRTLYEDLPQPSAKGEPGVAMIRPMSHLGLYLADMADAPQYWHKREWFEANDGFRRRVLELLGPRALSFHATSPTLASGRGGRPVGRTTATSRRC